MISVEVAMLDVAPVIRGLGYRRVHELTGVSASQVQILRSGRQRMVRFETARRLFDAPIITRAAGAFVPAAVTKALVRRIQAEGYSSAKVARLLKMATSTVGTIPRREKVRVGTARAVRALFDKLVGTEPDR